MPAQDFNEGDLVTINPEHRYETGVPFGIEGVILRKRGCDCLVAWQGWSGGHDGSGEVTEMGYDGGSGWYVDYGNLVSAVFKPFYLISFVDGVETPVPNARRFATGQEAAEAAKQLTLELGYKVQPRRETLDDNESWRERERLRMQDGTYAPMPEGWDLEPIADHFLHRSKDDPTKLAYTQDWEKGVRDIQTRIRPGAYLQRFYGDRLHEEVRKRYVAMIDNTEVLKFAVTADEIERVYLNGPSSCMSHPLCDYQSTQHPVRAYGDSDLQVAYLGDINNDVTARAVVWPTKKVWCRLYGDEARLAALLEAEGYVEDSIKGAKIRCIRDRDTYLMPYVDYIDCGSVRTIDGEKWIVLDDCGPINTQPTCGLAEEQTECSITGLFFGEGEGIFINGINEYCHPDAAEEDEVCVIGYEYYHTDYAVQLGDGNWVTQGDYDYNGGTCDFTDECYMTDDMTTLADGRMVYDGVRDRYCRECTGTGEWYAKDEGQQVDGEWYSHDYMDENPDTFVCEDGTYRMKDEDEDEEQGDLFTVESEATVEAAQAA